jgi:copper resistance protein C
MTIHQRRVYGRSWISSGEISLSAAYCLPLYEALVLKVREIDLDTRSASWAYPCHGRSPRFAFTWMIFCSRLLAKLYLVGKLMKAFAKLLLTACTLLLVIQGSWAHAFVDHAQPAVGSQIHSPPTQVKIWYNENLEPALSKIQVFDASGQEVDKRDTKIDQSNGAVLTVSLLDLKPGKYKVAWRAVSVDTHVTTGSFTFELI